MIQIRVPKLSLDEVHTNISHCIHLYSCFKYDGNPSKTYNTTPGSAKNPSGRTDR